MIVFSLILEVVGYAIKITLILAFWFVILTTTFNWLKISSRSPLIRAIRAITEPMFLFCRKRLPFLVQGKIDFSPMLILFVIILLHVTVVNTFLEAALKLRQ